MEAKQLLLCKWVEFGLEVFSLETPEMQSSTAPNSVTRALVGTAILDAQPLTSNT